MRKREDFFGCRYDAADESHERSLPVRENIAPSILKSTSEKLLAAVFPDCGKVFGKAASVMLGAMTDKGSPLVTLIPDFEKDGQDCDGKLLHVWNPEEEWKQDFGQVL